MISKRATTISEVNFIYALKVLAIISIVSAHSAGVNEDTNILNSLFSWVLGQIGSIGVGVFFVVSGYLFYKNRHSFFTFFKKKLTSIILPWVMTGTVVYLYVALRKGGLGAVEWGNFLIGNGSYLYYLTLLIFYYLLFFFTSKSKVFVYSTLILSCNSVLLTSAGVFEGINSFLNPFNFMWYFCIGLLIAENNALLKIAKACAKKTLILLALYLVLLIGVGVFDISSGYFGYSTLIVQPVAIALVFGLATTRVVNQEKLLQLGIESFGIYLLHMPIAGIITNVFNRIEPLWIFTLIRPLVVIAITLSLIIIYKKLSESLKIEKITNPIIGVR